MSCFDSATGDLADLLWACSLRELPGRVAPGLGGGAGSVEGIEELEHGALIGGGEVFDLAEPLEKARRPGLGLVLEGLECTVWLVHPSGATERMLVGPELRPDQQAPDRQWVPSVLLWSRDGSRVAFARWSGLWTVRVDGSDPRPCSRPQ